MCWFDFLSIPAGYDIESYHYRRHCTVISNFITYKTKNVLTQLAVNTLVKPYNYDVVCNFCITRRNTRAFKLI